MKNDLKEYCERMIKNIVRNYTWLPATKRSHVDIVVQLCADGKINLDLKGKE